jgi:hypothetical protein
LREGKMKKNGVYDLQSLMAIMIALSVLIGCGTSGGVGVKTGGDTDVVIQQPPVAQKGPPPWAPAHGHRAKYKYLYFPECPAYYDTDRSVYFYIEGANWVVSVSLPDRLSMKVSEHVVLEMDTDKPYTYYNHHKKKYPPGQFKKNKSNKWAQKGKK